MPGRAEPPQNTFVIRFWWEWQENGPGPTMGWRGRVEHVQSGEGMAFREARQLLAFMARFVSSLSSPLNDEDPWR